MITFEQISVKIGRKQILSDISFQAGPGECIGLIGANGSGKSTLLKAIAGILPLSGGKITADGADVGKRRGDPHFIGYVPQENPLFDDARAIDHLKLYYSGSGRDIAADLKEGIPAKLGVAEYLNKPVAAMSGGMKKRLTLACALAGDPVLILMDEPAAALDLPGKEKIRGYVRSLKEEAKTIILATHEEADFDLCDSFRLMENGRARILPKEDQGRLLDILLDNSTPQGEGQRSGGSLNE